MDDLKRQLLTHINEHTHDLVKSSNALDYIAYGTAGFRGNSSAIHHIFYRVGLVAGLRCIVEGANIGVMITASHNPVQDNGVKLINSNGEMLAANWEPIVEHFCNLNDSNAKSIHSELIGLIEKFNIDLNVANKPNIFIGFDTRPSSQQLVKLVLNGLSAWTSYVGVVNYGLLTTPALHYLVAESNKQKRQLDLTEYYNQLIDGLVESYEDSESPKKYYNPTELIVDCANGVGFKTMEFMCNNSSFNKYLPVRLINTHEGVLNQGCGADFVKTQLKPPIGANETQKRYASLDGDADRLIYFYLEAQTLKLLDGDKILSLYALFLKDVLKRANLDEELSLGIVQTAYANGASTDYLKQQLGLNVDCVDTGVKNLHKKAQDYDFAVYFEANGHGTIWISEKAKRTINDLHDSVGLKLKRLLKILNNYTGDAVSDILIVEVILKHYDLDIESWYKFYDDRPSSLTKVQVKDRRMIETTNAGRTCLKPVGLQNEIDRLVEQYSQARCFVRASGTEDVVRIYTEAATQKGANELAQQVGEKVIRICNT